MIKKDEDYQRSYMTEENVTQTQIVYGSVYLQQEYPQ